jgi:hypothetical protein
VAALSRTIENGSGEVKEEEEKGGTAAVLEESLRVKLTTHTSLTQLLTIPDP